MSHPQHQLRAFLDDGPHSGQTISVDTDADGQPPKRITVEIPSEGRQARQQPSGDQTAGDQTSGEQNPRERASDGDRADGPVSGSVITYRLHDSDEDLGLWVYRVAEDQ